MLKKPFPAERIVLGTIILAYLILGVLYAVLTPPWQVPDEPAHYNYVRSLVEERRLPVLRMGDYDHAYLEEIKHAEFAPEYTIDSIRYEFHQPPLYYMLLTPVYALSGGALVVLRLCTVLIGAGVLVVAYLVGKAVYPDRAWPALGLTAFIAFIPQHVAMTAGVENDALAELLLGIILLRFVRWLQADSAPPVRTHVITGAIIGLGLLTKTTAYIAVPLAVVAALLKSWHRSASGRLRLDLRPALVALLALLLPALVLSLLWFVRNAAVYGDMDLLGLGRHDQVVTGQLRTGEWIEMFGWKQWPGTFSRTTFRSFWAQFGWMAVPIDWRIYLALRVLSVIAAIGFVFRALDAWIDKRPPSSAHVLLLISGLLTLGTYLWYNLSFYQAQGRYLFPALIPLGLAWVLGLRESLQPRNARWIGVVLAAVTAYDLLRVLVGPSGEKWNVAIHGAGTAFLGARLLLPRFEDWLLAATYALLALVSAVSPFWFIVPYLTP